jgi:hypothetical protein
VTIDILPDNVFLEIFNFCINDPTVYASSHARDWQILVHVCRRWRGIIFASPRRLDLHLECSYGTLVRKKLDFWPTTLPLIVEYSKWGVRISPEDEDNIAAALEHPGRVRQITIRATAPLITKVATTLRKSFPMLTKLDLTCDGSVFPVTSKRFLGGSNTPRLQHLCLEYISLPQSPSPFSSARNLVSLRLQKMPANGYISPDAMVRSLAVLTGLKTLSISFHHSISSSDQWGGRPDPQMRAILPALTHFNYEGCSNYLEDFLARIDTPQVDFVMIEYFMHQTQASQLSRFIERTENLKIDQFTRAQVYFHDGALLFGFSRSQEWWGEVHLLLKISGEASLEAQVQDVALVIDQLSATISKVDDLFAHGDNVYHLSGTDLTEWLPLFDRLPAVETLRLSGEVAVYITSALEDTPEEMVADVFPALRLIRVTECEDMEEDEAYWIEQVDSMEQFLSFRQLSGCPVTVIFPEDELAEVEKRW